MDNTEEALRERIKRLRKAQTVLNMERRRISFRYGQLKDSAEKIATRWKTDSTLYGSLRVKSCPASSALISSNKYHTPIFGCTLKDLVYASKETLSRCACSTCLFNNEEIETLLMMEKVKGNAKSGR